MDSAKLYDERYRRWKIFFKGRRFQHLIYLVHFNRRESKDLLCKFGTDAGDCMRMDIAIPLFTSHPLLFSLHSALPLMFLLFPSPIHICYIKFKQISTIYLTDISTLICIFAFRLNILTSSFSTIAFPSLYPHLSFAATLAHYFLTYLNVFPHFSPLY